MCLSEAQDSFKKQPIWLAKKQKFDNNNIFDKAVENKQSRILLVGKPYVTSTCGREFDIIQKNYIWMWAPKIHMNVNFNF